MMSDSFMDVGNGLLTSFVRLNSGRYQVVGITGEIPLNVRTLSASDRRAIITDSSGDIL